MTRAHHNSLPSVQRGIGTVTGVGDPSHHTSAIKASQGLTRSDLTYKSRPNRVDATMHGNMLSSSRSSSRPATPCRPRANSLPFRPLHTDRPRTKHIDRTLQVVHCHKCATQQLQQLIGLAVHDGHSSSQHQVRTAHQALTLLMSAAMSSSFSVTKIICLRVYLGPYASIAAAG